MCAENNSNAFILVLATHQRQSRSHQRYRKRAVHKLAGVDDLPGVGADGQRALLRHDVRVARVLVGREVLAQDPLVPRRVAVAVPAAGDILQRRPALVRRVVRVQAVVGRIRVALDRDGLGLPQTTRCVSAQPRTQTTTLIREAAEW